MSYHPLTLLNGVVLAIAAILTLALVAHAVLTMREYRLRHKRSQIGSIPTPALSNLPLMLRCLYLLCACLSFLGALSTLLVNFLFVSNVRDHRNGPDQLHGLDRNSVVCAGVAKFVSVNYACIKLVCYGFYFIKQRTVRTMELIMGRLEKSVLGGTFVMIPLAVSLGWLVQGEASALDGTCINYIPVYLVCLTAAADAILSGAYLLLFIQPLRDTIAANDPANSTGVGACPSAAPTGVVPQASEGTSSQPIHPNIRRVAQSVVELSMADGTGSGPSFREDVTSSWQASGNNEQVPWSKNKSNDSSFPAQPRTLLIAVAPESSPQVAHTPSLGSLRNLRVSVPLNTHPPVLALHHRPTVGFSSHQFSSPPPLSDPATSTSPSKQTSPSTPRPATPTLIRKPSFFAIRPQPFTLERVMRRNTLAAAMSIASSLCHMLFLLAAMVSDESHVRMLTFPFACMDYVVCAGSLCYVLRGVVRSRHGSVASAAVGPSALLKSSMLVREDSFRESVGPVPVANDRVRSPLARPSTPHLHTPIRRSVSPMQHQSPSRPSSGRSSPVIRAHHARVPSHGLSISSGSPGLRAIMRVSDSYGGAGSELLGGSTRSSLQPSSTLCLPRSSHAIGSLDIIALQTTLQPPPTTSTELSVPKQQEDASAVRDLSASHTAVSGGDTQQSPSGTPQSTAEQN